MKLKTISIKKTKHIAAFLAVKWNWMFEKLFSKVWTTKNSTPIWRNIYFLHLKPFAHSITLLYFNLVEEPKSNLKSAILKVKKAKGIRIFISIHLFLNKFSVLHSINRVIMKINSFSNSQPIFIPIFYNFCNVNYYLTELNQFQ